MKKIILIVFVILSLKSYGQKLQDITFDDLNTKQARFIGGNLALKKFFRIDYKVPQDLKYGTLIGIVIINQNKNKVKTIILNSPGISYSKEVERVVQLSKNKWEKNDSLDVLYSTITFDFSFVNSNYFTDYDNQPKFVVANIALMNFVNKKLETDDKLVKELNDTYSQKDYKKVDKITKELIARNPFYPNFYLMRIRALKALNKDFSEELWMLTEFLNQKEYKNLEQN